MTIVVDILIIIGVFDSFAGFTAFYTFYMFVLRPYMKFRKTKRYGDYVDYHRFSRDGKGTYQGSITNQSVDDLAAWFKEQILGVIPKRDLNTLVKTTVDAALQKTIVEVIEGSMDNELMKTTMAKRVNDYLNEALNPPNK